MKRLDGKITLVTGAASGIGAATVRLMAREGASVVIADIHDETGEAIAQEIHLDGGKAFFVHLDVSREDDWTAAIEATVARYSGLDVLVNNAGVYLAKSCEEATYSDWQRICSVNLAGVFLGTKLALPALREKARTSSQGSAIINMSSTVGLKGSSVDPLYSMTKGGITTFTKSTAIEFGNKGYRIRVNSVHPGPVETEMAAQHRKADLNDPAALEAARQAIAASLPIKRVAMPADIATAVVFLASDDAGFMTGSSLVIDGGAMA
ncbi:NAD(P)-dependent dehydrogenase (short-subunit alcohol dehydrogenase family) [Paraburkholderia sp. BL6665CI2N2]|uniref:SDR family NAD(P)-dependent oxidoreductase n=1 Tax=Paraburkholderia sp. BL6665CI2N2 TaxID=1938806 RepID=UPI001066713D|nr:glucose 1-dehydrogenase [Paraburkholderia sp. BL6665CI2N2]TDY16828.1 NAD(P)-dependent dehydrogenase (short-subunit alcohol dehydrogenase family) [Paraburkholderia sp. BL6665CI2N2]